MKAGAQIVLSIADLPLNISLKEAFKLAKRSGADGVEIVLGVKTNLKKIINLSQQYNMPIHSVHQPLWTTKVLYSSKQVFKIAGQLHAKLVVHPLRTENITAKKQQAHFKNLAQLKEKYKIRVLLENAPLKSALPVYKYFSKSHNSNTQIENIYAVAKKYDFGITLDTSHLNATAPHQNKDLKRMFPYIENIHLSDFTQKSQHLPLGKGNLQIDKFLKFLFRNKYKNQITLELTPHLFYPRRTYYWDVESSVKIIKESQKTNAD